jgi:hypothetical protein
MMMRTTQIVWVAAAVAACGPSRVKKDGGGGDANALQCVHDTDCTGGGELCCSNVCVQTASCAFAVTQVAPASGFLDGGDWLTLTGAGFAPGMKVFIADGRAPVRVLSASSALIQTPPGPRGKQDLRIEVGSTAATLHGGFEYRTAGLDNQWEQKPLLHVRGEDPGLAVLQDGRVLIAGGTTVPDSAMDALATAEIYDRASDMVVPAVGMMSAPRWHDSAITLLDGHVLIVGGAAGALDTADLFDPGNGTFAPTVGKLNVGRSVTRSVLLVDGRVLVSSANDPSIEIYDPTTGIFTLVPHTTAHVYGFVVRLRDGRVLLGGGDTGQTAAELFDSDANTFTPTAGPMVQGRSMLTAHTLPSGKVAIIGGASSSAGGIIDPLATIELFDPATATFAPAPYQLATPRCWHASALVRDGTILVMGGYTQHAACESSVASVEQIDPVAGTVTAFPQLLNTNTEWTAVTMHDGSVLGVGGGACGTSMALPDIDFLAGAPIQ